MGDTARSIDIHTEKDAHGEVQLARIRFGPHYLVEVRKNGDKVEFMLIRTHHGFKADASEVDGELERIIEDVCRTHPEAITD